mmetsp:Transcript_9782/g.39727  ORF Transcript_9782/g.39727 Transcript_9782/m.39727 type:complete len:95 (-) Transcript_9782:10-294(-)
MFRETGLSPCELRLLEAFSRGTVEDCIEAVELREEEDGRPVNLNIASPGSNYSPLHHAVMRRDIGFLEVLLSQSRDRLDLNPQDRCGFTPFHGG